jgi:hypothetical protein
LEPPLKRGSDETRIIGWCQVLMELWQQQCGRVPGWQVAAVEFSAFACA